MLPKIANSEKTLSKLNALVYDKTGIKTDIKGVSLKVSPKLMFVLKIDSIDANYKNIKAIDIKDVALNYKLLQNNLTLINAENIYIDGNNLKQLSTTSSKENDKKQTLKKIPEVHIKNLVYKSDDINISAQNLDTKNDIINLRANITTPYLNETLKIGESGYFQLVGNSICANKVKIQLGKSQIYLNGILHDKDKSFNFNLKGENLPVNELMAILLHFQKSQDPAKKFIENFKNYTGNIALDLTFSDNGIFGKCIANNLGAKAVWFDIPLYFKKAVFDFKGKEIESVAQGKLGKEKVIHKLNITDLGSEEKEVIGHLDTVLTKTFTYVPNLIIKNSANVNMIYKIKYKKVDVFYSVELEPESDLIYNTSYLGLRDYKRKIYAHTFKDNNDLHLKEYKYSYSNSDKENIVISGDGLFVKINDKFTPQYMNCHTNGYAPISVTGSFGEKIRGGKFSGDLKYDYLKNTVDGTFDIINARYKAFSIDKAHVEAKNNIVRVTAKGLLKGEKYTADIIAQNNFLGGTLIYNMKLFLDKLIIETTPNTKKHKKRIDSQEFTKKVYNTDITINKWEIVINEIRREAFVLKNVNLVGSLKKHIFDFDMNELNFANGILKAKGIFNFTDNSSKITFNAKNIDSNIAANTMLNLQDQIEGVADATVNLEAKNFFRTIKAHSLFEIKSGFLPKLGNTEFMLENTKYKISQITNLDLTQKKLLKSDIKGSFDVLDTKIHNINVTSQQEFMSLLLEGEYDIKQPYANLQLYGKFDKEAPKGIKIFFIPLNLILNFILVPEKCDELYKTKLLKIPNINADEKHIKYFKVKLKGDINDNKNKLDITINEIKMKK